LNDPINPHALQVLIALGSNIKPKENIPRAVNLLQQLTKVICTSSVWQSPAVGSEGPDYLNAAVLIESSMQANEIKQSVLSRIETQLGRERTENKYADRPIDLDIILYGEQIIDQELWSMPHIAIPAAEIFPDLTNPVTGKTISQTVAEMRSGKIQIKRLDLII
jgi:2-amino-4-hydroxy-6-hydroxymethyldihydropteridine diphosphokinase